MKSRRHKRIEGFNKFKTYSELGPYLQCWSDRKLNLLILCGSGGTGKSTLLRKAAGPNTLYCEGRLTSFQLFRDLYEHRDELVVLDDLKTVAGDSDLLALLKSLCQTEPIKTISWNTATHKLNQFAISSTRGADQMWKLVYAIFWPWRARPWNTQEVSQTFDNELLEAWQAEATATLAARDQTEWINVTVFEIHEPNLTWTSYETTMPRQEYESLPQAELIPDSTSPTQSPETTIDLDLFGTTDLLTN